MRWLTTAPLQQRSRATMDRFAEAAERLLRERPFESISVHDIVAKAGRPTGSFYARFASKEALLPHLYQRYHDGLAPLFAARVAAVDWERMDHRRTCAGVVDLLMSLYSERRWLLRALVLFVRQHPDALPDGIVEQRQATFALAGDRLLRHRGSIPHPEPEHAVRFGLFMVSAVIRDKLLFPDAPHARATPMTTGELRAELIRALHGYLGSTP